MDKVCPVIPEQVTEIDINKKYVLAFEDHISETGKRIIQEDISNWLKREASPFLCLWGGKVLMTKLDDEQEHIQHLQGILDAQVAYATECEEKIDSLKKQIKELAKG